MENNDIVIDVKNLSKNFNGKPAVINVSLRVKRGEIFGFLGPNGSGKTTTIRMICGLLTPDSGEGHCLGYNIIKNSTDIKKHVGYMAQRFSLYGDLTVAENLEFIAELYQVKNRKQAVNKSIKKFSLEYYRDQLAGTLSGGWKQRLALSAALIHNPDLLLLDEPTAGVDPAARRDFWDQVHQLSVEGITTLVSTHYMDEAERCTRLAYIAYGHILTEGTSKEIVRESGLSTWKITGKNIFNLSEKIKNEPGIDQVVAFGTVLHVSGKDSVLLKKTIEKLPVTATEIPASLEDVFITLVAESPES